MEGSGNKTDLKKGARSKDIMQFVLMLVVIALINYVSSNLFFRLDLTSEKRYTLSDATIETIEELEDIVYFKVYLEGEFPAGFRRLRNETKEMLEEFRAYSGSGNIQYEFINPSESG